MRLINLLFCFFLVGCAQPDNPVFVPTPTPCLAPRLPDKIYLPISALTKNSSPPEVMGAYIQTVQLLIVDNNDLRARIKAVTPRSSA